MGKATASVHRFNDEVAVYCGMGETVYFTPKVARKLAKALADCVKDIGKKKFVCSDFKTVNVGSPV